MSTQPHNSGPAGKTQFFTPAPTKPDKKDSKDQPAASDTAPPAQTTAASSPAASTPQLIPEMGWPALWYGFKKLFNKDAKPPKLSQKEIDSLQRKADEERAQAEQQAEEARIQKERKDEEERKIRVRTESVQRLCDYADRVPSLTVVFIGVKGAAGTTTTDAHASSVLGDIVRAMLVATDLNPAQGTLASRLGKDYDQTINLRDLLSDLPGFGNFREFIRRIRPTRYSVRPISANDIVGGNEHLDGKQAAQILDTIGINTEYHYIDTANDITDEVTLEAVKRADVLVFTAYVGIHNSLQLLSVGMETLRKHGYTEKVDNGVVVISGLEADDSLENYRKYTNRVNMRDEVVATYNFHGPFLRVPYDPIIRRDTEVDLGALDWETYQAYLELNLCIFEQAPEFEKTKERAHNQVIPFHKNPES